jgi:hypothetical protein
MVSFPIERLTYEVPVPGEGAYGQQPALTEKGTSARQAERDLTLTCHSKVHSYHHVRSFTGGHLLKLSLRRSVTSLLRLTDFAPIRDPNMQVTRRCHSLAAQQIWRWHHVGEQNVFCRPQCFHANYMLLAGDLSLPNTGPRNMGASGRGGPIMSQ